MLVNYIRVIDKTKMVYPYKGIKFYISEKYNNLFLHTIRVNKTGFTLALVILILFLIILNKMYYYLTGFETEFNAVVIIHKVLTFYPIVRIIFPLLLIYVAFNGKNSKIKLNLFENITIEGYLYCTFFCLIFSYFNICPILLGYIFLILGDIILHVPKIETFKFAFYIETI